MPWASTKARQMRNLVLLFSSFILIDMSLPTRAEQPTEPKEAVVPRVKSCSESIPGGSTEEFNKKCIALAGSLAAMRGELLVLRMDNGTKKSFNNKDGSGAAQAGFGYGLADFYPSTHIFVVGDFGADTTDFTAIDGRTGRKFNFGYASPKFSPDGNWVLSIEYSGDDEIDSNFAIVDVRGKKPVTVWASKTWKTRLPPKAKFVEWVDDKTIKLMGAGQKSVFLIQADNGAWSISSTPPAN